MLIKFLKLIFLCFLVKCQGNFAFRHLTPKENDDLREYCGKAPAYTPTIVFKLLGTEAEQGRFPWAVFVLTKVHSEKNYFDGTTEQEDALAKCSGVLISQRHVLTAAHCFYNNRKYFDEHRKPFNTTFLTTSPTDLVFSPVIGMGGITVDPDEPDHVDFLQTKETWFNAYDPQTLSKGYDYAFVEIERDITVTEMKKGNIVPICMSLALRKEMRRKHEFFKHDMTLAAFGAPDAGILRYDPEIRSEPCRVPYDPCHCPLCSCALHTSLAKNISHDGDSGGGTYLYEETSLRAHLYSILSRSFPSDGLMVGTEVLDRSIGFKDDSIIEVAKSKLSLSY